MTQRRRPRSKKLLHALPAEFGHVMTGHHSADRDNSPIPYTGMS